MGTADARGPATLILLKPRVRLPHQTRIKFDQPSAVMKISLAADL
jgi:hypothetical protein